MYHFLYIFPNSCKVAYKSLLILIRKLILPKKKRRENKTVDCYISTNFIFVRVSNIVESFFLFFIENIFRGLFASFFSTRVVNMIFTLYIFIMYSEHLVVYRYEFLVGNDCNIGTYDFSFYLLHRYMYFIFFESQYPLYITLFSERMSHERLFRAKKKERKEIQAILLEIQLRCSKWDSIIL